MKGIQTKVRPERGAIQRDPEEWKRINASRSLRSLVKDNLRLLYATGAVSDCSDTVVDSVMKSFDHWLRDVEHGLRMAATESGKGQGHALERLRQQGVVSEILELLNNEEEEKP